MNASLDSLFATLRYFFRQVRRVSCWLLSSVWYNRRMFWALLSACFVWFWSLLTGWNLVTDANEKYIINLVSVIISRPKPDAMTLLVLSVPTYLVPLLVAYICYQGAKVRANPDGLELDAMVTTSARLTLFVAVLILVAIGLVPILPMLDKLVGR